MQTIKYIDILARAIEVKETWMFNGPVALYFQIKLKNLGINTAMTDPYTLKFISKS